MAGELDEAWMCGFEEHAVPPILQEGNLEVHTAPLLDLVNLPAKQRELAPLALEHEDPLRMRLRPRQ